MKLSLKEILLIQSIKPIFKNRRENQNMNLIYLAENFHVSSNFLITLTIFREEPEKKDGAFGRCEPTPKGWLWRVGCIKCLPKDVFDVKLLAAWITSAFYGRLLVEKKPQRPISISVTCFRGTLGGKHLTHFLEKLQRTNLKRSRRRCSSPK